MFLLQHSVCWGILWFSVSSVTGKKNKEKLNKGAKGSRDKRIFFGGPASKQEGGGVYIHFSLVTRP